MLRAEGGGSSVLWAERDGAVRGGGCGGAEFGALGEGSVGELGGGRTRERTFLDSFSASSASILASSSSMKRTPLTRNGRPFCCSHAGML